MSKDREEVSKKKFIEFPQIPVKKRKFTGYNLSFNNEGSPVFSLPPQNFEHIIELFGKIKSLFKIDGTFNPSSPMAEEYAICLDKDGKHKAAAELFADIVGNAVDVLEVNENSSIQDLVCHPVANKPGKLGYLGAICYASLCLKESQKEKEEVGFMLLEEIVEKIPKECVPFGLQCVLVEALEVLIEKGIKIKGMNLPDKLDYVKEQQQHIKE